MIEIKNIIFANNNLNFLRCFFCFVNYLLPLKLKFANETFVILVDKKIKGLITLDKDSMSNTRFKITKLILEENSYSLAYELTNYVLSRYRAMGAASFYAVVDNKQKELLNIFKNDLNFRSCALEHLYKINPLETGFSLFLKPFRKENIKEVCSFYNDNINFFNRFLFGRETYQFKNKCKKYVFLNEEDDKVLGYFEVASKNNFDYYINFSIDFAYNIYLVDAIKFIYSKLKHKNKSFNLYIKVKDYFLNSKELLSILKENSCVFVSTGEILAKDYYRQIKDESIFKNAKIIFNDPTIA